MLDSPVHDKAEGNQFRPSRDKLIRLLLKVATHWGIFPNALILTDVQLLDDEFCDSGAFAIVYRGKYDGKRVALKKPRKRETMDDSENMFKVRLQLLDVLDYTINRSAVYLHRHFIVNRSSTKVSSTSISFHLSECHKMCSRVRFVW